MNKTYFLLVVLLSFISSVFASTSINGSVTSEIRTLMIEPYQYSYQSTLLDLFLTATPSDQSKIYAEIELTSTDSSSLVSSSDLSDQNKVTPLKSSMIEAYYKVYNFLIPQLELKIGRQRIAWGRGDKINPTDNINADDLSDLWNYGKHLASDGINLNYLLADSTLEFIYIPLFKPALLPTGDYRQALLPTTPLLPQLTVNNITDTIHLPANNLQTSSTFAIKVSKNVWGYDCSLSWINGHDDLPIANKITLTPVNFTSVDINADLVYPRLNIAGFDLAGSIGDIGVWAEVAVFVPEQIIETTDLSALAMGTSAKESLAHTPYTKFLIGLDYTFSNNIYLNMQYLHGFIHERGLNDLNDYLFINVDWTLLDNTLTITPVGVALEVSKTSAIQDHYAFLAMPQLAYKPIDQLTLTLGGRWIWGSGDSTFGKLADNDEVFVKGCYKF